MSDTKFMILLLLCSGSVGCVIGVYAAMVI